MVLVEIAFEIIADSTLEMGVETFLGFELRAWPLLKIVRAVSLARLPENQDLAVVAARGVLLVGIEDIAIVLFCRPQLKRLAGKFYLLLSVMKRDV